MADAVIDSIEQQGDTLHIYGSGFTRTTTTLLVNGESQTFEWISDTEITAAAPSAGAEVVVEKGGIQSAPFSVSDATADTVGGAQEGHTADTSTTPEGEDDLADATQAELAGAAGTGAEEKMTPQDPAPSPVEPEVRGEHVKSADFRLAVHQSPVTRVDEDLGIGVRDPYPTGNPPDQREIYHSIHGVYKEDSDDRSGTAADAGPNPQAV